MRKKRMLAVACLLVVSCAVLPGAACLAQPAASPAPAATEDPQKYAAGAVVRLALLDLRAVEDPKPRDFAVTLALLNAAQALAPDDVEIARRRSEAAWNAADQAELLSATE